MFPAEVRHSENTDPLYNLTERENPRKHRHQKLGRSAAEKVGKVGFKEPMTFVFLMPLDRINGRSSGNICKCTGMIQSKHLRLKNRFQISESVHQCRLGRIDLTQTTGLLGDIEPIVDVAALCLVKLCVLLAKDAEAVVRMVCGIPTIIKGQI